MRRWIVVALAVLVAGLACEGTPPSPATEVPPPLPFEAGRTAYGFFPSPPKATLDSVLNHFRDLGKHADYILIQPNIPWEAMVTQDLESQPLTDIGNQVILAGQNGLGTIFVVDPLNGLNRREFMDLPENWEPTFGDGRVRQAFTAFASWIASEYRPRYLGLASEINTYADAHPQDFPAFLSLYRETYAAIKEISPETQVFVTFQWEDLNNLVPSADEGRAAYATNWDQVEAFEPELDLWVISSYPFIVYPGADKIPDDYYTPLLTRTDRPLAVGEGGYIAQPTGPFAGDPADQVAYLDAVHRQIGARLAWWTYLLLSDFDPESYREAMVDAGRSQADIDTLGIFETVGLRRVDGTSKPGLGVWDAFRNGE